jgi:hypothetical protein
MNSSVEIVKTWLGFPYICQFFQICPRPLHPTRTCPTKKSHADPKIDYRVAWLLDSWLPGAVAWCYPSILLPYEYYQARAAGPLVGPTHTHWASSIGRLTWQGAVGQAYIISELTDLTEMTCLICAPVQIQRILRCVRLVQLRSDFHCPWMHR